MLPERVQAATGMLTGREQDVASAVCKGLSNKEIACRLGVGVRTVETHRANLFAKLGADSSIKSQVPPLRGRLSSKAAG